MAQPVVNPEDWVEITYKGPAHQHIVMGRSGLEYGYYGGGDKFQVLKSDQQAQPSWFALDDKEITAQDIQAQIEARRAELAALEAAQSQLSLHQETQAAPAAAQPVVTPQQPPAPEPAATVTAEDDLMALDGIGEVGNQKLRDAGVTTYAALAQQDAGALANLLGAPMTEEKAMALIAQAATK